MGLLESKCLWRKDAPATQIQPEQDDSLEMVSVVERADSKGSQESQVGRGEDMASSSSFSSTTSATPQKETPSPAAWRQR
jgi:hypothetical protein